MTHRVFLPFLILGSALLLPSVCPGYLHSGHLEFHPVLQVSLINTSNLYQEDDDSAVSENIIQVSPGIGLRYPTTHHLFRVSYNANIYSLQDQSITKVKHSASGTADVNFPGGLYLRFTDSYQERIYPSLPEDIGITEHRQNLLHADVGYKSAGRWCLCFGYRLNMLSYPEPPSNISESEWIAPDRDTHSAGITLTLRALAKLSINTELWYGMIKYKESMYAETLGYDAATLQAFFGIGSHISPKTILSLRAGYEQRSYESEDIDPAKGLVATISLIEKLSPVVSFELEGSRAIHESIYGTNSHYVSTGGGGSLSVRPIRLLSIGAQVKYEILSYSASENIEAHDDTLMTISPRFKLHIFSWLEAGLGYSMLTRSSDVFHDYQENRISVSVGLVY